MVEDPSEVLSHLHGLDYPASKQELISAAEARGARQEVVEALQVLEQSASPTARRSRKLWRRVRGSESSASGRWGEVVLAWKPT